VTIQRYFKGFQARKETKMMKFMKKRLARLIEPYVKKYLKAKRVHAASCIQRMFRRFKARKLQLERLRLNNERRRLQAEEDERKEAEEAQLSMAAKVIQRQFRKYQGKIRADLNYQLEAALRDGTEQSEIVNLPSVRKCFICKKSNAIRQCGPGVRFF
jgi:IQ calmodulin-binding motif